MRRTIKKFRKVRYGCLFVAKIFPFSENIFLFNEKYLTFNKVYLHAIKHIYIQ